MDTTLKELRKTRWWKRWVADMQREPNRQAIEYALAHTKVFMEEHEDGDEWTIRIVDDPTFVLDLVPSREVAVATCHEMGWQLIGTQDCE